MNLSERDRKIIWHPFTQEKVAKLPIAIKKAHGSYLYDENSKPYLDLISSWWVNLHGHAHPKIAQAIYEQSMTLEHVIFAGFTHEPAVTLCEKLKTLLPDKLSRFFFSDNGSTAVEVALKMAYQYWWNQGNRERTTFLSFEGGYHGDTFGAMSVGVKSGFHDAFSNLLFSVLTVPFPETWDGDEEIASKEKHSLEVLEGHLRAGSRKIAALILEPLVQGASGMRMCRPEFVRKVVDLVRQHGILIICDEVMTGFGRTGTYFAFEQTQIIPDFLCISKGLTGGFLPLALTVTTEEVYLAFLSEHFTKAFAHGHSYTANPLGCAAAIASLDLLVKHDTMESIKRIHNIHKKELISLSEACKNVQHAHVTGTIAAFDIHGAQTLKMKFLEQGLLIRPLGNSVYLLPPYSISTSELEEAYNKIRSIFSDYKYSCVL
ncbi:adenosylmethionine--8-amino-7-oxononanoate transaminase [Wolbachia endosymbiont of Cimex lectularius]|uniref:Adenosylmethionine-8-amino-7-oxononanoate aminotransferase n=4 Tax=unclassified Wolbachia TaxID=2640676 RepID=A0A060Q5X8_9RICK|nr:adenosylmethionine--8-amino-7-oxononanoate transaminase [Wolbachia endosymbiont of Cimex lectularius]BAP00143.1 adenosylmethionine-8-amino-7-oxononanoate transaminase [Wolbachia endosymbiont of Cimex lectularius]BAP01345.1 adenosylmethionine-8-amino-7-oxononanoate aminotransferase [Wolbachia sp. SYDL]BAP01353.1 adenosylmethionine-8-amino-7-oxononanoate aminotransferase [Wolbachia sp. TUA]BAP01361.1 adenosylmethionine-8-amino-7-oxononanoate aminotransferase [Wolbachia sp. TIH]